MNLDKSIRTFREPIEQTQQLAIRAQETFGRANFICDNWPTIQTMLHDEGDVRLKRLICKICRLRFSRFVDLSALQRKTRRLKRSRVFYKTHPMIWRIRLHNLSLRFRIVALRLGTVILTVILAIYKIVIWFWGQVHVLFTKTAKTSMIMKGLKLVSLGIAIWGLNLLWPEFNLPRTLPVMIGIVLGLGTATLLAYVLDQRLD